MLTRGYIVEPDSAHTGRREKSGRYNLVPTLRLLSLRLLRNRTLSLGGTRHEDEPDQAGKRRAKARRSRNETHELHHGPLEGRLGASCEQIG